MEKGKTGTVKMLNKFEYDSDLVFESVLKSAFSKSVELLAESHNKLLPKIYFAGPWFDKRSNMLYDMCQNICNIFKRNYDVYFPREEVNKTPKDAFDKNVTQLKQCDIVVALVSKKDVGTAWEIGMAYALNKPVYLLGYDESSFLSHTNVMLAFTGKCFTIHNLGKFLTNNMRDTDFVTIENIWEGIE